MISLHLLRLHGELGIERREWIEGKLGEIALFGPNSLTVLDLTDVCYADTTLLNALMQVKKRCPSASSVYVAGTRPIKRLFQVTELDQVFPVFETVNSACWHGLVCQTSLAESRPSHTGLQAGVALIAEIETG